MAVWAQGMPEVSGINTAPGQFMSPSFNVQVNDGQLALRFAADGAGNTFALDQLAIAPAPVTINGTQTSLTLSPATLPTGTANSPYSVTVSATGGSGTYTFAVTSGSMPSGLSLNASTGVVSGTPTATGTSSFTFTATDSNTAGLTGNRTYTLAVNVSIPNPPVVSAGANISTKEGAAITFVGTVMGGIAPYTYMWDFGDGDTTSGNLTPTYTYANSGTYTVTLTVTDVQKQIGQSTLQVTVQDVAPSVTISGTPASSPEGALISLTSTVSSPSATETAAGFTYSWNVTKNGTAYASATTPTLSFTPTEHGAYVVTLLATAQDQGRGTASQTITITDVAPLVTINGVPASSTTGTAIALTSSVFSPSTADTVAGFRYAWSVTSNGTIVASGSTANLSFTPASAGSYVVALTVTDGDGATGTAIQSITVTAAPGGWTHVQDDPGGGALNSPTATTNTFSLNPFPSPVTIGDYVLVGITGLDNQISVNAVDVTCTDNATTPNSYTQLYFHRETTGDQDGWVCLFAAKVAHNPSSGNLYPTINIGNGKTSIVSWAASEFSGGSLTLDGSPQVQEYAFIPPPYNTTVNLALTTTQPNDLLIGIFADNRGGSYTWTLPSGFTALGTQSDGNNFLAGQWAYRIVSGTLSNQQLSWSNNGANQDGTVCAMVAALEV
jgi:PKD repeat protein